MTSAIECSMGVFVVKGKVEGALAKWAPPWHFREVPSDFPVAARASQVLDLSRGLTIRAQMGTPRKTLLKDAEEAADLVLLPRRGNATPEG